MFCTKCGSEIEDDAMFCNQCGTKVSSKAMGDTNIDGMFDNSTELIISIAKVEDRRVAKWKFLLLIDDIPIDELSNGQEATYKIQSGEHCIKIGACSIWVNISANTALINLNYMWSLQQNVKPEIVCLQEYVVTKPSEIEKISIKNMPWICMIGLACCVLGLIGIILAYFLMPVSSGSIVSAEEHSAALAAMPSAMGVFIGGFVLMFIGVFFLNLHAWRKRKEIRRKLQNRKSAL